METTDTQKTIQKPLSANSQYSSGAISIKDMYTTTDGNSNFEWEKMNYRVPRQYFALTNIKKNSSSKNLKRTSYLDIVEELGRQIPGVGEYTVNSLHRKSFSRPDIKAPKRKTLFVELYEKGKRQPTPGPACYNTQENKKSFSKKRNRSEGNKASYLNEVEYLAGTSPGIGQYNIQRNILKPSFRNDKSSSGLLKTSKNKSTKIKMSDVTPLLDGTFQKISHTYKKNIKSIKKGTFGSDDRFKTDTSLLLNPAPNKYDYQKCTSSTLTKMKSIYY